MNYTREIAEEVLNDFYEYSDVIISLFQIEDFLDDNFPPQLPDTGWLKSCAGAMVYRTGGKSGFGIDSLGRWEAGEWSFISSPEMWQPATREEVEEALINFARKKGYKNGNYKCLAMPHTTFEVDENIVHIDNNFDVWHGDENDTHNLLFNSITGKWAEIIEDENRELKEQIQKLEKQLNELKTRL